MRAARIRVVPPVADAGVPPAPLARHGLGRVTDNLPPGVEVAGFERDFALIFREELAAKFLLGGSER